MKGESNLPRKSGLSKMFALLARSFQIFLKQFTISGSNNSNSYKNKNVNINCM